MKLRTVVTALVAACATVGLARCCVRRRHHAIVVTDRPGVRSVAVVRRRAARPLARAWRDR